MQPAKKVSFVKFIPGIAWFIFIYILITLPGKDIPKSNFLDEINVDKLVHMSIFGLLAVLFCWPFYKSSVPSEKRLIYFIVVALLTIAWGYTTELIQKLRPELGRTYDLYDWAADSIGAIIGFIFSRKKFSHN